MVHSRSSQHAVRPIDVFDGGIDADVIDLGIDEAVQPLAGHEVIDVAADRHVRQVSGDHIFPALNRAIKGPLVRRITGVNQLDVELRTCGTGSAKGRAFVTALDTNRSVITVWLGPVQVETPFGVLAVNLQTDILVEPTQKAVFLQVTIQDLAPCVSFPCSDGWHLN